jgi:hypothetical protein
MTDSRDLSSSFSQLSVTDKSSTLKQVSAIRDILSEEDHKKLDNAIFDIFTSQPALKLLLKCIVNDDARLITITVDQAMEIIAQNPGLKSLLEKAWIARTFKAIRRLGFS